MKRFNKIFLIAFLFGFTFISSCTTDDLDPTLASDKDIEGSIKTPEDLNGILLGAYNRMTFSTYYGRDFIIHNECRTDNTYANGNSGRFQTPATFNYIPSSNIGVWTNAYQVIGSANIIIGQDASLLEGDQDLAKHYQGQAYAIRALAHFDLLRNYGEQHTGGNLGVPYVTEFKGDDLFPSRNTVDEVKTAIMTDLQMAFDLMSDSFYDGTKETMSKYTAKALESKIAIYFEMWNEASAAAKMVMDSGLYSIMPAAQYVASFGQKGNPNSIFELAFSPSDNLGGNDLGFIYRGDTYGDIQVLPNVLDLYSSTDIRRNILGWEKYVDGNIVWVPLDENPTGLPLRNFGKYPSNQGWDNIAIVRYEEVLLNYAEALFETGGDAAAVLNQLTSKRNADAYTTVTKDDILNERRKELIFEGFRYDDLLRTGQGIVKVDFEQNIMESIPAGDYRLAMPIPIVELDANANMVQNRNY